MCGTTNLQANLDAIDAEAMRAAKEAVESIWRGTATLPAAHRVYALKAFEKAFIEEWKRSKGYGTSLHKEHS
jgi:hypothetical protein